MWLQQVAPSVACSCVPRLLLIGSAKSRGAAAWYSSRCRRSNSHFHGRRILVQSSSDVSDRISLATFAISRSTSPALEGRRRRSRLVAHRPSELVLNLPDEIEQVLFGSQCRQLLVGVAVARPVDPRTNRGDLSSEIRAVA